MMNVLSVVYQNERVCVFPQRMRRFRLSGVFVSFIVALTLSSAECIFSQGQVLDKRMYHLWVGDSPEWADFTGVPRKQLIVNFTARQNTTEQALQLRQEDVKQGWRILLNGRELGKLHPDEKAMIGYWSIPVATLQSGKNTLRIEPADTMVDDIRVGEIVLRERTPQQVLSEAMVDITVADGQTGSLLPARITIIRSGQALQTVGASSNGHLAVRPGFVYTGDGKATFGLPAGTYTLYAGRGFEYGIDSVRLVLQPGDHLQRRLLISREVPTQGWISSDTHIHTLTYSGHGDATVSERVLTIAGEGIELPILTEHNKHVNVDSVAKAMRVHPYFTSVMGNEFTTKVGHFNVFPVAETSPVPNYGMDNWEAVSQNLHRTYGDVAVILNHARDVHNHFRPFGLERHLAVAGTNVAGWNLPANAMEVINSGSQQSDRMRLYQDWFGMLNRGYLLTPVGASDSHDVSRYLVGQARTYIRCNDDNPGDIDVRQATEHFLSGKVMVSFGLLAEMTINGRYGSGELVPAANEVAFPFACWGLVGYEPTAWHFMQMVRRSGRQRLIPAAQPG